MTKEEIKKLERLKEKTDKAQKRIMEIYEKTDEDDKLFIDLVSICSMLSLIQALIDKFGDNLSTDIARYLAKIIADGTHALIIFDESMEEMEEEGKGKKA